MSVEDVEIEVLVLKMAILLFSSSLLCVESEEKGLCSAIATL